jgi:formylglycine-generating enzyme required for sulfatase activity/Leucine-rich repeat (LRR) protein/predicted Ser/Thr protein kinase
MVTRRDAHPSPGVLHALSLGKLDDATAQTVLDHLETCADCRKQVEAQSGDAFLNRLREAHRPGSGTAAYQGLAKDRILLTCPGCGKKLSAKVSLAGKKIRCPNCAATLDVPALPPAKDKTTLPPEPADTGAPPGPVQRPAQGEKDWELCNFLAPAQAPDELGRLGPYRVLAVLGAGGMGVVYKAEDPQLKRLVALKAMLPTMGAGESARKRFLREAQAAAAINHDNIVHIYQVGEDRGAPFIAMQFLEGESLETLLRRSSRLSPDQVLRIGRETADGLAAAHQRGLIHRDIKPPNLWLEGQKRRVKILDFGIARAAEDDMHLTQTGAIIGTVGYMAPEQASGKGVDHRSDLFSLGCVLYRMCTARMPFKGSDTISFLSALALETPKSPAALNPEVPARLSDLIMRLLAKKPEKRPQSAQGVSEALQRIEEEVGQETARYMTAGSGPGIRGVVRTTPGWSGRLRPPLNWLLGAAGGLLAVLIAGIVLYWPTPRGVIKIESNDPSVEIVFDNNGPTVKGAGAQPISLGAGEHGVHIKRDDFEFDAEKFVLEKGQTISLKVELLQGKIQVTADGRIIGAGELPPGFMPLFNGKDLDGWEGLSEYWSVKDGALVGSTLPEGVKFNTSLCSKKKFRDFELSFKVRLTGKGWSGNSGVQIRSRIFDRDRFAVEGPQCDIGDIYWGSLYGEHSGGMMKQAPAEVVKRVLKENDFNDYSIKCVGKHVTIKLNGESMVDGDFEKLPEEGIIAWQLHTGPPMEVTFKDIRVADLMPRLKDTQDFVPLFNGMDLSGWVVDSGGADAWQVKNGELTFRAAEEPRSLLSQGYLLTEKDYKDFRLRFQFQRSSDNASSGIALRAVPQETAGNSNPGAGDWPYHLTVWLGKEGAGGLWWSPNSSATPPLLADQAAEIRPAGEWNDMEVEMRGQSLRIMVNGRGILNVMLNKTRPKKEKFPAVGLNRYSGRIGFLKRDGEFRFRKIEIKELPPSDVETQLGEKESREPKARFPPAPSGLPKTLTNSIGMEFVLVPKGKSWLGGGGGSPGNEEVVFADDFYLGKFEVTQEEWRKVTGLSPSSFSRTGGGKGIVKDISDAELLRFPVDQVSWDDAQSFLQRLNNGEKEPGWIYRLPKEAEWEYACRGGPLSDRFESAYDFYFDKPTNQLLPEQANFGRNKERPCKVGSYQPNRLGLYDMHGNVWEWCDDAEKPADAASRRILRGGSWAADRSAPIPGSRAISRSLERRSYSSYNLGLRVARVPLSGSVAPSSALEEAWIREVSALPAERQVTAVVAKLKERNPGFDGTVKPEFNNGVVTGLKFMTDQVTDIAPLRALTGLKWLDFDCSEHNPGQLADLSPLKGMRLTSIFFRNTRVSDLMPLKGMPLRVLACAGTPVSDLSPLEGMPLRELRCPRTQISDLSPVKGMRLEVVGCWGTKVADLSPLKGMPLKTILCGTSQVFDLSPLKGMPLTELDCSRIAINDLSALKGMNLTDLRFGYTRVSDLSPLKDMKPTVLCCPFTPVTDAGLIGLENMSSLRYLELCGTSITDAGLVHLERLTGLTELRIDRNKLTGAALVHLKRMTNLRDLRVFETKVTDDALVHLKSLQNLQGLQLANTRVTDAGLEHLARLKKLIDLNLYGTAVTDEGVSKLNVALPACKVTR